MVYLPGSGLGEGRPEGGNTEGHEGEKEVCAAIKRGNRGLCRSQTLEV